MDVEQLYPSLELEEITTLIREAIINSNVKWQDVDWLEARRFLELSWSEEQCKASKLRDCIPRRRKKAGKRPGMKGQHLKGKERGDQEQWLFQPITLGEEQKKEIIAAVVTIAVKSYSPPTCTILVGRCSIRRMGAP